MDLRCPKCRTINKIPDHLKPNVALRCGKCHSTFLVEKPKTKSNHVWRSMVTMVTKPYCYVTFCIACFAIALTLGWIRIGSVNGISPDSITYINAAQAIRANGISSVFNLSGFGPLYPLSIAGLTYFGFGFEQAARLVTVLCFALLMFPIFFLGKTVRGVSTGYLACLVCLAFWPLWCVALMAWTEMLYILLSTLAVLFLVKFSESREAKTVTLFFSGLFVTLAVATRFIGLSILVVGLIVIAIKNKSRLRKTLYQMLFFGFTGLFVLILWIYEKAGFAGNLGGYVLVRAPEAFSQNVFSAVRILVGDFYVNRILNYPTFQLVALVSITLLGAYALARLAGVKGLRRYLSKDYVVLIYIFVYSFLIIWMTSMVYSFGVSSRYLTPIYPFMILAAISFLIFVFRQIRGIKEKQAIFYIITLFLLIFLLRSAYHSSLLLGLLGVNP